MRWNKFLKKIENNEYTWVGDSFIVQQNPGTKIICNTRGVSLSINNSPPCPIHDVPIASEILSVLAKRKFEWHEIEPGCSVLCHLLSDGETKVYVRPNGNKFSVDKEGHIHFEEDEL